MSDYKIQLGVALDTSDLSTELSKINEKKSNKVKLGIDLKVNDIRDRIREYNANSNNIKVKLKATLDTDDLRKQINKLNLNGTSKGKGVAIPVNTQSLETSLNEVKAIITDVRNAIGTLDNSGNIKFLVSSINQMATALGKAENESDSLVKSLSALSKKDFSVNFGIKLGGSNSVSNNVAYSDFVKDEVLPTLKKQERELEKYLSKYFKTNELSAINKLAGNDLGGMGGIIGTLDKLNSPLKKSESLKDRMREYKNFINTIISSANIQGVDLSPVLSQFDKLPNELIESAEGIRTGVKQTEDGFEKLKGVFSSGVDTEKLSTQLDSIVIDLGEIKTALQELSSGFSLDGLTSSFDKLSNSIENLLANAEKVKGVLNNNLNTSAIGSTSTSTNATNTSPIKSAQQTGQQIGETITKSAQQSINLDDVIDKEVLSLMKTFSIAGDKGSDAFNEIRQALVECRSELQKLKNSDVGIDEEVFDTSRAFDKVSDAIANQMRAVNSLGDEYIKLAKYMTKFNDPKKGNKVRVPDFIKQEQGDDYKSSRGTLGIAFNTEKGISFASFIEDLNHELGIAIDLTKGEEKAYEELVHKLRLGREQLEAQQRSQSSLQANASTDDILAQNYINKNEIRDVAESSIDYINAAEAAEKAFAQTSTQATNTVAQNEERKQQAYRETFGVYEKISRDISLVGSDGSFQKAFEASNQASQKAQRHFQELLADEKAVVSVTEQFDDNNALQSFAVNVKRATGEVETLRYAMDKLNDEGDEGFAYQGGSTSDRNVEKQRQARIKAAKDLQVELDKIKSGYKDAGASKPIKDDDHIKTLDVQYRKVEKAIIAVRNADDSTFSSMVSNAKEEQSALENMVREYRNAENVATSLRSKDIDTVKATYASKLDNLILTMKDAGVYTSGFEKGAENLRSSLSSATDKSGLVSFLNGLDKLDAGYKRVAKSAKSLTQTKLYRQNASGIESEIKGWQRISPEINQFEAEIDGAKVSVQSLLKELSQVRTKSDFQIAQGNFKNFKKAAEAAGITLKETAQKLKSIKEIKFKLSDTGFNGFKQEVARAHADAEKLEGAYNNLDAALDKLDAAMADVYSADQAGDVKKLVAANEEYESSLKQVYSQLKLYQQEEEKVYKNELLSQKKASLNNEMEIWLKDNTRAVKNYGEEIRKLQASLDGLDDKGVKLVGQQFKNITKQAQAMGKTGLTVFDKLKSKAKEYMTYLSAAELFMYAEQAFREMFNTVKEIDTAMTGLYRVTDLTSAEYDTLFNNMISSAKEYGATLNDIINATTDWVHAGFDANTSLGLAEVTTMYQHISDLDYDTAAENLITAYNGFKDELNGAFSGDTVAAVNYIADIFNELDNNFAVTSAGLGEALTRSASALDLAGNTIQETAGMVTGIVEVTQDPEKAGKMYARTYSNVWCNYKIA